MKFIVFVPQDLQYFQTFKSSNIWDKLTSSDRGTRPAPHSEVKDEVPVNLAPGAFVPFEQLHESFDGLEGGDSQQSWWGLHEQGCNSGRPFRMEEAVLVAQVVGEHGKEELEEGIHTLFLWQKNDG